MRRWGFLCCQGLKVLGGGMSVEGLVWSEGPFRHPSRMRAQPQRPRWRGPTAAAGKPTWRRKCAVRQRRAFELGANIPSAQERLDSLAEKITVLDFTFPNHQHVPARIVKAGLMRRIASPVTLKFRDPIVAVRLWGPRSPWTIMLVPEASMDENHFASRGEYQIGFSGKVSAMQAIPITHAVSQPPHSHFGSRIPAFHCAHRAAAIFRSFRHFRISIFRLGSVSTSSTISL